MKHILTSKKYGGIRQISCFIINQLSFYKETLR